MDNLAARCPFESCTYNGKYTDVVKHMLTCPHEEIPCIYKANGCTFESKRTELGKHATVCPYRSISCECNVVLKFKDYEQHLLTSCPKYKTKCEYKCGETLTRQEMDFHMTRVCEKRPVNCLNNKFGCLWHGEYYMHKQHLVDCKIEPLRPMLETLFTEVAKQKLRITALEDEVAKLKQQPQQQQAQQQIKPDVKPTSAPVAKPSTPATTPPKPKGIDIRVVHAVAKQTPNGLELGSLSSKLNSMHIKTAGLKQVVSDAPHLFNVKFGTNGKCHVQAK